MKTKEETKTVNGEMKGGSPKEVSPIKETTRAKEKRGSQTKPQPPMATPSKEAMAERIAKKFVRIGTNIFRVAYVPSPTKTMTGEDITYTKSLHQWNRKTLEDDYGKAVTTMVIDKMLKTVAYSIQPSHTAYKQVIEGQDGDRFYNLYEPIPFQPKEGGTYEHIIKYLTHIFGDQLEEGLDYLQVMYLYPTHKLPILALVSKERETAKTTFLNLLVKLFGNNTHFIRGDDLGSNFNNDWTTKLCVCMDDVDLRKEGFSDKIRNISTSGTMPVEAKGKDRTNAPFFGKLLITSNKYNNFAFVDSEENRYWVRYVPKLKNKATSPTYLEDVMMPEIPAFLHFLLHRQMKHPEPVSRMWLPYDAIHTEWLDKLKANSGSVFERELVDFLTEMFEALPKEKELKYTLRTLKAIILESSGRKGLGDNHFKNMIQERFGIAPSKKTDRFYQYTDRDNTLVSADGRTICDIPETVGKPLIFTREMLGLEPIQEAKQERIDFKQTKE